MSQGSVFGLGCHDNHLQAWLGRDGGGAILARSGDRSTGLTQGWSSGKGDRPSSGCSPLS